MSKGISIILSLVVLSVTLLLFYQFGMSSLASTDKGVDLTGTQYEQAYNSSVDTSIAAVNLAAYPLLLVGAFSVLVVLMLMIGMTSRKKWG